jgi:hypothetical protein
MTADSVIATGTGGHYVEATVAGAAVLGTAYTFSVYLKPKGWNFVFVVMWDTQYHGYIINIQTGEVGTTIGSPSSYMITPLPDGWFRVSITRVVDATALYVNIETQPNADIGGAGSTGDGTSGVYAWGAQLEAGAYPASYIPTITAQVTRSQDATTLPTAAFPHSAVENTMVVEFVSYDPDTVSVSREVVVITASTAQAIYLGRLSLNNTIQVYSTNPNASFTMEAPRVPGLLHKMALACKADDYAACMDGVLIGTDTAGAMPVSVLPTLVLGQAINGHIRSFKYIPRRVPNIELQAMSVKT